MRLLLSLSALLLTAACGPNPSTSPAPATGEDPPPATGAPGCPPADAPCMNAENHAQCLEVAATCKGEIVQLESCPLQFECDDGSAGAPGDPGDPSNTGSTGSPGSPGDDAYQPCAGKACGEGCSACPPGDADCVETAVVKYCHQDGQCMGTMPKCES